MAKKTPPGDGPPSDPGRAADDKPTGVVTVELISDAFEDPPSEPAAEDDGARVREAIADCIENAVPAPSPAKAAEPADGGDDGGIGDDYRLEPSGLWYKPKKGAHLWLCGPLKVEARTTYPETGEHGLHLSWIDYDGIKREVVIRRGELARRDDRWLQLFMSGGLEGNPERAAVNQLKLYLARVRPEAVSLVVRRTGWFEDPTGRRVFVLPDQVIGAEGGQRVLLETGVSAGGPSPVRGTLDEWQRDIAALAVGNSRLALVLLVAFAGSLLRLTGDESGGVHLRGGSSLGKTTALRVADTVWGGDLLSWRATVNGIEGVAVTRNDGLASLDEISQASPKEVGDVAYMLANGEGKSRAAQDGSARPVATWRLLFLSTGETALGDMMAKAGGEAQAGQDVRILDLPADAREGYGLFDRLPDGFKHPGALAEHLRTAAERQRGTAGRAFVEALFATGDLAAVAREVEDTRRRWVEARGLDGSDGQVLRVARRFGLIAAAGALAARLGILPWPEMEAERAAVMCFGDWLDQRGGTGPREIMTAKRRIEDLVSRFGAYRFQELRDLVALGTDDAQENGRPIADRLGYKRLVDGHREWLFSPTAWKREVIDGLDLRAINAALCDQGILRRDGAGKATVPVKIDGTTKRFYVVREDRLLAGGAAPGSEAEV